MRTCSLLTGLLLLSVGNAHADPAAMAQEAQSRGLPLAAAFHAARAKAAGVEVDVRAPDTDALWNELPTRPALTVPESCEWLRASIEAAYPSSRANVVIDARLTCTAAQNTWTENQAYVWYTTEQHEETQTVGGETTSTIGNCWTDTIPRRMYACSIESTTPTTTEQVTVTDQIPHDATHDVTRRTMVLTVRGTLSSPDARAEIDFDRTVDEIEFSDEHGSQAFTTSGDDLVREAMGAVTVAINALILPVRQAQIEVELAAASSSDGLAAEEHRLRAWTLGDPATALAQAYGLTESELAAMLITVGFEVPWDLQVALFQQDQEREARAYHGPKRGPGVLARMFANPQLTIERTTRVEGNLTSLGFGARLDLGWRLRKPLDYALGLQAGGGTDDEHGTRFDARAGVALGLSSARYQLAYLVGLGVAGSGVRLPGEVMSTLETKPDVFHGLDLRIDARVVALDTRVFQLKGGALGDELRASAQVLVAIGHVRVGLEGSVHQYEGNAGTADTKITAIAVTIGLDKVVRPRR